MTEIPEWIATLVGRLVLESESLRRALTESLPQGPDEEPEGEPERGDN